MSLSEHTENRGGRLSTNGASFLGTLPELVYKDTREPFKGSPAIVRFEHPETRYFDHAGLELVPLFVEKREPKDDFLRNTWKG